MILSTSNKWSLTWETVPINKHICAWFDYTITLIKREERHNLLFENWMVLICLMLNSLHTRIQCVKFNWIGRVVLERKILSVHFSYFVIISPWKRVYPFLWTNLIPLYPRMLCAKFGWKLAQWFWRRRWKYEKFTDKWTDRWTTGDQKILSFQLRWPQKKCKSTFSI